MDLKGDPFERAYFESEEYKRWMAEHLFLLVPAQAIVGQFLKTFKDYPQRQPIGSFSLDRVLESMNKAGTN
jgi:arylsulfatase